MARNINLKSMRKGLTATSHASPMANELTTEGPITRPTSRTHNREFIGSTYPNLGVQNKTFTFHAISL